MSAHPLVVAIIPARGGSKRMPAKNRAAIAGVPLVTHSIRHARGASCVSEVLVSTDDEQIAAIAAAEGAEPIIRPVELSHDTATSESALVHALDVRLEHGRSEPDLVVFLQCTSPVRTTDDIDRAVATLTSSQADSLFSGCENTQLIWSIGANGLRSINYDYHCRRREQDMERQIRENGSIYVFKPWVLREQGNRLGGRIACYEMDYWSSFQIDTPKDLELCEWILERHHRSFSAREHGRSQGRHTG